MYSRTATVLLADAYSHSGLAVARSLSRHGVSFVVVGSDPRGMVAVSRHVRSYVVAPSARTHAEAFGKVVLEAAERYGVRLVVPITDSALAICNEQRDLLPAEARLAAAGSEAVRNVLDKRRNLETARRLAIPCPAEFALTVREQIPELIARLGFPMVLKNPGFGSGKMSSPLDLKWVIVRNESDLRARVAECAAAGAFPIFQQLVEGEIRNLCCFATRGKIAAFHEYRSVRRLGWEGTGVVREVTEPTPGLVGYAERLLDELAWDGVAHLGCRSAGG
jgi:biotin carboxylase